MTNLDSFITRAKEAYFNSEECQRMLPKAIAALEFIMGKVEAAQLSLEQICPSCCAGDVKEQLQRDVADIERILGNGK